MNIIDIDPLWKLDQEDIYKLRKCINVKNKYEIDTCKLVEELDKLSIFSCVKKIAQFSNFAEMLSKYNRGISEKDFAALEYLWLQLLFPSPVGDNKRNVVSTYLPSVISNIVVSYMEDPPLYERGDLVYIGSAGGFSHDYRNANIYILEDEQKLFAYNEEFVKGRIETFSIAKTQPNWKRIMNLSYNHSDYGTILESFMAIRDFPITRYMDKLYYSDIIYADLSSYEFRFATDGEFKDCLVWHDYFHATSYKRILIKFTDKDKEYYLMIISYDEDNIAIEIIRNMYFRKPIWVYPVSDNVIYSDDHII